MNRLLCLVLLFALVLAACSQPPDAEPVAATATTKPAPSATAPPATPADTSALRPIPVETVEILSGAASPIPALVAVSGTWPDLCAQLAQISQPAIRDFELEIELLATAADPTCPTDRLGLPFYLEIPLNWGELPTGQYRVAVNGAETALFLPIIPPPVDASSGEPVLGPALTPTPGGDPTTGGVAFDTADAAPVAVPVDAIVMEIGVGSPIPVAVHIAAGWPSLCAQIAEIRQELVSDFRFEVTLLAHPGRADCPTDAVGYGFGINLPLNVVELAQGTYTVDVNGMTTAFDVPVTQPAVDDPDSEALCPEVTRPALALFVPGETYVFVNPLSGEECTTSLADDLPGLFQAASDGIYYLTRDGEQFVVRRVAYDGTASLLPFTAFDFDDAVVSHGFAVSADGQRLAWTAGAAPGTAGSLWLADAAGREVVKALVDVELEAQTQRALQPIRFSADNSTLFYAIQPVGIGGSWAAFQGRYDNLYALRLNTDAEPALIFDCAEVEQLLCIGDFYETDAQVTAVAYMDGRNVVIQNGLGKALNTIAVAEATYVGYPTFGPGGDLVFYSATLSDDSLFPASARLHRVAPYTAPAEVIASDPSLLPPQGWLDASHVIVAYLTGADNWGTALVDLEGTITPYVAGPTASYVTTLPAP